MNTENKDLRDTQGSVLIVAIIFATIAALAIGSYIRLAGTEMRLANQQFYGNASLNLAEAGVEEALYAINLSSLGDEGWEATGIAGTLGKYINSIELGRGATGSFRVHVVGAESTAPKIVSEGKVRSGANGRSVRQVEVRLYSRSLFGNGIMANDIIMRGGNIEVNSYSSLAENFELLESSKVASTSLVEESMDLGNANIYGSVATRGWEPRTRPNTLITDGWTDDFDSDLPDVQLPDYDLTYHYYDEIGPGTLGDHGQTRYIQTSSIKLTSDEKLEIHGDVVLIVDNDIDIHGEAGIVIDENASLKVYVEGDVSIGGTGTTGENGIVNKSETPANLQLYGTNLESQSFSLSGNAAWYGTVYAPNGSVILNGGGNAGKFYGAVVAGHVTMNGNTTFYYDVELADLVDGSSFAMGNWRERFGDERYVFE